MASNDEYQQQNEWRADVGNTSSNSFMEQSLEEQRRKLNEQLEKIVFTAQEGSLLDRIWKKSKKQLKKTDKA